jgi:hypothetical protein
MEFAIRYLGFLGGEGVYGFKVKWLKESVECSLVKARGVFRTDSKWQPRFSLKGDPKQGFPLDRA